MDILILTHLSPKMFLDSCQEEGLFNKEDGFPRMPFPNGWKGKNGLYAVGFTKMGLLGASISAQRVAEDIACYWNCKTKQLCLELQTILN